MAVASLSWLSSLRPSVPPPLRRPTIVEDLLELRLQLRLLVLQLGKCATPFLGRIRGQLDATCKQPEDRRALLALANRLGVPVLFLECRASLAEVERRLRERERRGDAVSDANWAVALREQDDFPAFADLPDRCHLVIDTEGAREDALAAIEEYLLCPPPP